MEKFEKTKVEDLKNSEVPDSLYWSVDQVCDFFEKLNLPEYKHTLRENRIDGRKLVYLDASHLPQLGIQDFKHILLITKSIRKLQKMQTPYWNTSISFLPKDKLDLYLEQKSRTGLKSDSLNYVDFKRTVDEVKWMPPLTNQGFTMPSF